MFAHFLLSNIVFLRSGSSWPLRMILWMINKALWCVQRVSIDGRHEIAPEVPELIKKQDHTPVQSTESDGRKGSLVSRFSAIGRRTYCKPLIFVCGQQRRISVTFVKIKRHHVTDQRLCRGCRLLLHAANIGLWRPLPVTNAHFSAAFDWKPSLLLYTENKMAWEMPDFSH